MTPSRKAAEAVERMLCSQGHCRVEAEGMLAEQIAEIIRREFAGVVGAATELVRLLDQNIASGLDQSEWDAMAKLDAALNVQTSPEREQSNEPLSKA